MCHHIFSYPEDKTVNYNPDKETLMGICKVCGAKESSYGRKWAIPKVDDYYYEHPYGVNLLEG